MSRSGWDEDHVGFGAAFVKRGGKAKHYIYSQVAINHSCLLGLRHKRLIAMRKMMMLPFLALVAGCGGESGTGSTAGSSGSATPVPAPAPAPAPAPIYPRYSELLGNQTFKTSCALNNVSPPDGFASPFGSNVSLNYLAATDSYALVGPFVNAAFGPSDLDPAAPAGSKRYLKPVNGFTERFSLGPLRAAATNLEYTQFVTSQTRLQTGAIVNHMCIFGVPTLVTDAPSGSNIPFAKVSVSGTAWVTEGNVNRGYTLSTNSTATLAANVTTGRVTVTMRLVGSFSVPTTATPVPDINLGDFVGAGDIDVSQATISGQFDTTGNLVAANNFSGWFFGPRGAEAGLIFAMTGYQGNTPVRVVGIVSAIQR
jgi:hypothetical protein